VPTEEQRLENLRQTVTAKVTSLLQAKLRNFEREIADAKAVRLTQIKEEEDLKHAIAEMESSKAQKEESLEMFRKREKELEDWLRENENMEEMGPDELLRPTLALPQQLERVTAEDVVIDETLYVLDKGLENGRVPLERLMSEVKKLARRQFKARALRGKLMEKLKAAGVDVRY